MSTAIVIGWSLALVLFGVFFEFVGDTVFYAPSPHLPDHMYGLGNEPRCRMRVEGHRRIRRQSTIHAYLFG